MGVGQIKIGRLVGGKVKGKQEKGPRSFHKREREEIRCFPSSYLSLACLI